MPPHMVYEADEVARYVGRDGVLLVRHLGQNSGRPHKASSDENHNIGGGSGDSSRGEKSAKRKDYHKPGKKD